MSMIMSVTDAIVSQGYQGQAPFRFNERGDFVRFRFGNSKYDKDAPDKRRWINMSAKAYGAVCERIKKMQLKEGAHVNLIGEYDEETWTDANTQETRSAPAITLIHIEYAGSSGQASRSREGVAQSANADSQQSPPAQGGRWPDDSSPARQKLSGTNHAQSETAHQMPDSFEGYQSFDLGVNPYFPEES